MKKGVKDRMSFWNKRCLLGLLITLCYYTFWFFVWFFVYFFFHLDLGLSIVYFIATLFLTKVLNQLDKKMGWNK